MATIHPPANGHSYNREEAAANTHISFRRTELTAEQMIARDAALRANSATNYLNSHSARAAAAVAEREARRAASAANIEVLRQRAADAMKKK